MDDDQYLVSGILSLCITSRPLCYGPINTLVRLKAPYPVRNPELGFFLSGPCLTKVIVACVNLSQLHDFKKPYHFIINHSHSLPVAGLLDW